jgi:hypothetical protein
MTKKRTIVREKRKAKIIQDPKKRGEWVESVFMARAGEQGLEVSRPWGDSNSYDFVVGRPGRFVGVQVKSTTFVSGGGYTCVIRKQGKAYARGSFDFVAAYVVPEDVWYIIPVSRMDGRENMSLCSDSNHNKNEEFREAWHLLKAASAGAEEDAAEVRGVGSEGRADVASGPPSAPQFGGNVLERMEAVAGFVRRQMEGRNVHAVKRGEDTPWNGEERESEK